jgi:hypothetical protein
MVSRRGAIAGPPAAPRPLAAGLLLLALGIGTALARPEQVQLSVSEDEENSVLIFWCAIALARFGCFATDSATLSSLRRLQ